MENKGYYAVLPANVRYDRDICPGAKLLYAEITALSNERGFCWANNNYFSLLYGVHVRTIQLWLKALRKKSYIMIIDLGSQRKIYIQSGLIKIVP